MRATLARPLARRAALAAAAASLAWAGAAGAATQLVPRSTGMTAPTGVVETPDGARWVADHVKGVCRVAAGGAGLVEGAFCAETHAGPSEATGLAFDPETGNFYSGDGSSGDGAIWRLRWSAASGAIEDATLLVSMPEDRVSAVALAPGAGGAPPSLLYATKRSEAIMRLSDPAGPPETPETVGFAAQPDAMGVAELGGSIYIADGSNLSLLRPGSGSQPAARVPAGEGTAVSALAADHARGRLYLGTDARGLADRVLALDPARGELETYDRGFSGVYGLGVAPDGALLVADDPGTAALGIDSMDQARLWRVPLAPLGRPSVRFEAAPPAATSATSATFRFTSVASATFECRLDAGEWAACDGVAQQDELAEGLHTFEARAATPDAGVGLPARRVFTVDLTAPSVQATVPERALADAVVLDAVADEWPVAVSCSLDGGAFEACETGERLTGLEPGEHTLRVIAMDAAGNVSDPLATRAFARFVVLSPPPPAAPAPAPAAPSSEPAPASATPTVVTTTPQTKAARPLRLLSDRMRVVRTLRLAVDAPAGARWARVMVYGQRGAARPSLTRDVRVRAGAANTLTVRATPSERRRLRPGRYLVVVRMSADRRGAGKVQAAWLRVLAP